MARRWYREAWLAVITLMLVIFAVKAFDASDAARDASRNAVQAVATVQQNRLDLIESQCIAQNKRNANTIRALNFEINRLPRRRERRRAKRNERYTISLIDTLAPRQDCAALVARARIHKN